MLEDTRQLGKRVSSRIFCRAVVPLSEPVFQGFKQASDPPSVYKVPMLSCLGNLFARSKIFFPRKIRLALYIECLYSFCVRFEWDPDKNEWLKRERSISFEEIVFHLSEGDIWKIADHPNQKDYLGQRIYFVVVDGYVYMVPHVIEKDYVFLKTVIPSRKATKDYSKGGEVL